MDDENVVIAIVDNEFAEGSLLAIGDHAIAASRAPMPVGYRQTLFIRPAPTVLREISQFDAELDAALAHIGVPARASRMFALNQLAIL